MAGTQFVITLKDRLIYTTWKVEEVRGKKRVLIDRGILNGKREIWISEK